MIGKTLRSIIFLSLLSSTAGVPALWAFEYFATSSWAKGQLTKEHWHDKSAHRCGCSLACLSVTHQDWLLARVLPLAPSLHVQATLCRCSFYAWSCGCFCVQLQCRAMAPHAMKMCAHAPNCIYELDRAPRHQSAPSPVAVLIFLACRTETIQRLGESSHLHNIAEKT